MRDAAWEILSQAEALAEGRFGLDANNVSIRIAREYGLGGIVEMYFCRYGN